jgi:restriction system protein
MSKSPRIIVPHGGYQDLKSYQNALIVYDATVEFCNLYIDRRSRTHDQMVQAARSGKQNIAEGSMASGTSAKMELKLVNVARASQEELLIDYTDFLRQRRLPRWDKHDAKSRRARNLAFQPARSYIHTYRVGIVHSRAVAANMMVCLIHQTNYLLDRQLRSLERRFLEQGGFTERLYRARRASRG